MNQILSRSGAMTSIITLALCVSACGGGSSGSSGQTTRTAPTPPPVPDPSIIVYDTAEFRQNPSLAQMNVQVAYENGISGQGVVVAVIDSGVTEVPELQGQLHANSTNIATGDPNDSDDFNGHGTSMAGIIAANRDHSTNNNTFNMHGVAFNAQILNINATTATDCTDFDNCSFFHSNIAKGYDYAISHSADVINESLGSDNLSSIGLQQAVQRAVNADIVIVVPAGNIDDDTPANVSAKVQRSAEVAYAPWANGQIIIAGSVDRNNVISDFSYRAGEDAKNVFLVAPGSEIIAPDHDDTNNYEYIEILGTSASTAQISGVVALLIEAFPSLNAAQTADLLFTTATDLGDPGVDTVYGHGLVNVEEAFTAQGTLSIAGSGFAAAVEVGTNDSLSQQNLLFTGGAFGGEFSFTNSLSNIMVLDKYNRSFTIDFRNNIYALNNTTSIEGFMSQSLSSRHQNLTLSDKITMKLGWQHDSRFAEIDKRHFSNHLGLEHRAENLRMSLAYDLGDQSVARMSSGMSLAEMMEDYRPDDFIAQGKHGFSSLLSAPGTSAVSYKRAFGNKINIETAFARSKSNFGENIISRNISLKNTLVLNRITRNAGDKLRIGFDFGLLEEKGSVLGAISTGALEIGSGASTAFIGTKLDYNFSGKTKFFAQASYGMTSVDQSSRSILGDISTLKSYSYLFGLKSTFLFSHNDQLSLTVSQPLRLASGYASISNAVSRNYATNQFTMSYDRFSLNPAGTERDFELSYALNNVYGLRLQFNLLHQLNPGHVSSIESATSALFRLGSAF